MYPHAIRPAQSHDLSAGKPERGSSQPLQAAQIAEALLTLRTASAIAGLSIATLYRRAKDDPSFPRLIRMGARCTRIRAADLTAWLSVKAGG